MHLKKRPSKHISATDQLEFNVFFRLSGLFFVCFLYIEAKPEK